MQRIKKRILAVVVMLTLAIIPTKAADIKGKVIDKQTREPLIGATIQTADGRGVVADADGRFLLTGLSDGSYNLIIKYIGYKTKNIDGVRVHKQSSIDSLIVEMEADNQTIGEVKVTGTTRRNTEIAMISATKSSPVIVSNVSAQEIQKTQDGNAGEVIRRVPGVSIIEDKFVMVRGLSQRYNNVWINGGAVPSSEADSRAFSFDIIPSSQLDNLTIIKTPSPEYPADYCGGFIIINTKEIPTKNSFDISIGGNYNDKTSGKNFIYSKSSGTDFLGFDNGLRSLKGGMSAQLNTIGDNGVNLLTNGFNNDCLTKTFKPIADLKLSASMSRHWFLFGNKAGMIASINYTNEYRTYENMQNNLFGVYDAQKDKSNYLRYSLDNQYNNNVRLGAMLNFTFLSKNGNNKYQFKNIFNQIGNNRYTWREGVSAQSDNEQSAEYYYRSRTTYNTQLTGSHMLDINHLDWSASYSFANRTMPDRRRYLLNDALETGTMALSNGNDLSREWTKLDEHIVSANINYKHQFRFGQWEPYAKIGAYGEYRTREYTTRNFIYNWNAANNTLPNDFRYGNIPALISNESNFGETGLYLIEQKKMRNNYKGNNTLGAAYMAVSLPFGVFNVYAGVRFEHNRMELITNTRDTEKSESSMYYTYNDIFPSLNTTYKINDKNQLRLSYGRSVNRPEFREVSPSVYYDFDLASDVQGNTELNTCYIDNIDLRYEFYPSKGEIISLAAFYKHFDSPIEWTYTVSGGTDLVYSYKNARNANNYGIELDIRKDLTFIGLPDFSWSFNGALIKSKVSFASTDRDENRPMQGQSPYLINTGIFYKNEPLQLQVALLYNRIGKRIIGVGRSEGTTSGNETLRVPDSYEMPRDVVDLTLSKKFGNHIELKFNVRDIFAQSVVYKQFAEVSYSDGTSKTIPQITRKYKPGRNILLAVTYKF